MFYVYMIKDKLNKLYVGISENPKQRLNDHNRKAGAAFTAHGWFEIVFLETHSTLKEARSREVQIKKWRREKKDVLISRYLKGFSTKPVLKL